MRKKVTVVGSGNVGATAAHWMAAKELCDVVLIDIIEGVPQGKGLDLLESMPIEKRDSHIIGTNDYADTANSDIVVITAGIPRKPGMSRDDLLHTNFKIMSDVVAKVVAQSPESILIIVSNPLDAMARYSTVAGIPLTELIEPERLEQLIQRTRDGGAEIVKYLKTGSAYYAPSAAATEMVDAIIKDKKKILPCAAFLQGEYGINGLYVGVPCKLGAKGLEQIIEIKLTPEEKAGLDKSAAAVKELVGVIGV